MALSDATPENSCIYVIPKQHDPGYLEGDDEEDKNMHDQESTLDYTKAAAQLAEAAARIKTIQKLRKNK